MSEMTDFDICKKVAQIEGINNSTAYGLYNPLADKALCFDLMVKHKIDFFHRQDIYSASDNKSFVVDDKNPQRAICVAVIEKHEH